MRLSAPPIASFAPCGPILLTFYKRGGRLFLFGLLKWEAVLEYRSRGALNRPLDCAA